MDVSNILSNWGLTNTEHLQRFDVDGARVVCKVRTEIGIVILKGQPISTTEKVIIGNIQAHEFNSKIGSDINVNKMGNSGR